MNPHAYRRKAPARRLLLLSVLLLTVLSHRSAMADTPPAGFFPIGVYRQPTSTFDLWKGRGINTVIDFFDASNTLGMNQFNKAALASDLWVIRNPTPNLKWDQRQKNLLAYSHADEPDINNISPKALAKEYKAWKAAAPSIPVITNFSGVNAIYQFDSLTDVLYQRYLASTNWVSNDIYPITAWNHPQWIDLGMKLSLTDPWNLTGARWNPGTSVDKLRQLSGGKKQLAYIETSFQNLSQANSVGARAPTADEVRGETWDAIIHGATGIVYFPFTFPGTPDGTAADVAAEMTQTDAMISHFGAQLNVATDKTANAMKLTGSTLEGTWRTYKGKRYYFVLNDSHTAASNVSVLLQGLPKGSKQVGAYDEDRLLQVASGSITDSFAPYELHVYTTDTAGLGSSNSAHVPVLVGAPVPEPSGVSLIGFAILGLLSRRRRSCRA